MKILVPKRKVEVDGPLFFLAGPIRGGGDWQKHMCLQLEKQEIIHNRKCTVVSPCRWKEDHSLSSYFLEGGEDSFPRQLNWERYYLEKAGNKNEAGCIIFWLPCQSKANPHPGPEPYAMDTRGELGEWRMRMKYEGAKVVIGAEEGFLGLSQIQRNFTEALGYEFPIYDTMHSTVRAAVRHI